MPKELTIRIGNGQIQGTRRYQEDYFATVELNLAEKQEGILAIVADGMGGHDDGGNTSVLAVEEFIVSYKEKKNTESISEALYRSLHVANEAIVNLNQQDDANRGTTLVACVVHLERLYWVSVGDSRLFHYREGKLCLINTLHSYEAHLEENQSVQRKENSLLEKNSHMLMSYLGLDVIPKIAPSKKTHEWTHYPLQLGDKILLCTDGLTDALSEEEIKICLQFPQEVQQTCDQLLDQISNKKRHSQDNTTVILLELKPKLQEANPLYFQKKLSNIRNIVVLLLILLVSVIFAYLSNSYSFWLELFKKEQQEVILPADTSEASCVKNPTPNNSNDSNIHKGKCFHECKCICESFTLDKVQTVLQSENMYKEKIDGTWGKNTERAIKAFQKQKKLPENDTLNEETCEKLYKIYQEKQQIIDNNINKKTAI